MKTLCCCSMIRGWWSSPIYYLQGFSKLSTGKTTDLSISYCGNYFPMIAFIYAYVYNHDPTKRSHYDIMVPNSLLYHHVLECINACIITSEVVVEPCCNFAMDKSEHTKLSSLTHTKVYSLLHFLSRCWEKEREYESWVDCVS